MAKLIFATGNKDKLREAENILEVKLDGTDLEIDEIQSLDGVEVAIKKARSYYEKLKNPLFVEDSVVTFEPISPLPGPYIKDFWKALGSEGLCRLLDGKSRKVTNTVFVVFIDENGKENIFQGETMGTISEMPKGTDGWGWDPIFIPEGSELTYGEMDINEKRRYSARNKALLKFKKWLQENQ